MNVVISATGLYHPPERITNAELVASFNAYVERFNRQNAAAIASGTLEALQPSSVEFIEKASGIKNRYAYEKRHSLDIDYMVPRIPERPNEALSVQAEFAANAGRQALARAQRDPADVDAIICSAAMLQRPYPAIGIEVQQELGTSGFAYDMAVACSSATFAIQNAYDLVAAGHARSVLVERAEIAPKASWAILKTKLVTKFSSNIRNNFGFLNRSDPSGVGKPDKLITQQGRKVFREVVPMVSEMILQEMAELGLKPSDMRRLWLHQANSNMNRLIAEKVLGHEASEDESPTVLGEFGNTAGAGSIIAFHRHCEDLKAGDKGLICSFGAGYSIGAVFVQKNP